MSAIEGVFKNITEFGLFVGLDNDIDGMVHLSDLSWDLRGEDAIANYRKGDVVTVTITAIEEGGVEVEYNGVKSFIRRSDLARDRQDQRPERFQVGDNVDARVTNIDTKTRRLGLSIKAREIAEEKEAVEQYGSSESGASLGDILGAALKSRN